MEGTCELLSGAGGPCRVSRPPAWGRGSAVSPAASRPGSSGARAPACAPGAEAAARTAARGTSVRPEPAQTGHAGRRALAGPHSGAADARGAHAPVCTRPRPCAGRGARVGTPRVAAGDPGAGPADWAVPAPPRAVHLQAETSPALTPLGSQVLPHDFLSRSGRSAVRRIGCDGSHAFRIEHPVSAPSCTAFR